MRSFAAGRRLAAGLTALVLVSALAGCTGRRGPRTPDDRHPVLTVELLGVVELAKTTPLDAAPVGGLSALAWEPSTGLWLALSDDRGDLDAAPRFYGLRLSVEDGRLDEGDVEVVAVTELLDLGGEPFTPGAVDPEGLAVAPGGALYLSSEGVARRDVAPWVREIGRDGVGRRELALPAHFLPGGRDDDRRGVRDNLGFESLTLTPDGTRLITASEAALAQDGPSAAFGVASRARVLVFDPADGRVLAEHVYEVDPLPRPAVPGGVEIGGLVELLALDGERLLALERSWAEGAGQTVRLYQTTLAGARDVRGMPRLAADVPAMDKRLLLDFAELDAPIDNVEGMALGPALADGRRLLAFVADDNFSAGQRTLVYAFALSGEGIPAVPPVAPPTIADIQGAGHRSPFRGATVEGVGGVVTAVVAVAADEDAVEGAEVSGFWIEDPVGDGDPATSEGLWVNAADAAGRFAVAVGDRLLVAGRVAEVGRAGELTTTTLRATADGIRVLSRGNPLPGPRRIAGDEGCPPRPVIDDDGLRLFQPGADGIDFWESLEGMRVEVADPQVVGPTSRFGEIVVVAAGCAPSAGRTARGGLLVAADDFHPERVHLDDRLVADPPQVAVGDRFAGPVVGVLDYGFGNYKLLNVAPLPPVERAPAAPAAAAGQPAAAGDLTVATLNVENLSVRDPAARFAAHAEVIVERLGSPAVVALQEIQDDSGRADDGVVTAEATLARLAGAIEAAGGPRYVWRQIDPEDNADGGAPGGNIRVAFLVDPRRARPVDRGSAGARDAVSVSTATDGRPALSPSPGRIAPQAPAFAGGEGREPSRKPLAFEVEILGRPLFLVVVHFRSKGGDGALFGAFQPPPLASEPQRVAQAEEVASFTRRLLAVDPGAWLVVLGDFNDFAFRPPLAALAGAGLVDLVERLPLAERYTYVYEGNSQVLDHILVSPALAAAEAGVAAVHVHADFPSGQRASDHDPVVARFRLPPRGPAGPSSALRTRHPARSTGCRAGL
ncbi:MAG TPA: esterase-like activity of phytase family protein [Thermoanaerobaculia bacterium]|nr:esterase-like activity of phytase family protein [Thermoanaerobaculia bacterium]